MIALTILPMNRLSVAGECNLGAQRIKELGLTLFCSEFERQNSEEKPNLNEIEFKNMQNICGSGSGPFSMNGIVWSAGAAAAFTIASEYFINKTLVKRMIPFVTDAMVNTFMKGAGISESALRGVLSRLGPDKSVDVVATTKEIIRRELAKVFLQKGGYHSFFGHTKELASLAAIGTQDVLTSINKALAQQLAMSAEDEIFRNFMRKGELTQAGINHAQRQASKAARDYLKSQAFAQESEGAVAAFDKSLGRLKIPIKLPVRIPLAGVAGAIIAATIQIIGSPSNGSCTDRPGLDRVVERDPNNNCQAKTTINKSTIRGLLDPEETQKIIGTDQSSCDAYTSIYRQVVFQMPETPVNQKIECKGNTMHLTWADPNAEAARKDTIHGYKIERANDGVKAVYLRPKTWSNKWVFSEKTERGQKPPLIAREMINYCSGFGSSVFAAAYRQDTPSGNSSDSVAPPASSAL